MISPKPGLKVSTVVTLSEAQPEIKNALQSNKTDLFITKRKIKNGKVANSLAKHSKNVKSRTKNEKNSFCIIKLRDFDRLQQRANNQWSQRKDSL